MTEADRCILTEIRFSVIMELWNTQTHIVIWETESSQMTERK